MCLRIYNEYGFKFFPCKADKSPDTKGNWKDPANHITLEQAESLQRSGSNIGAWIPEGIICIDLDKHKGKRDGVKAFNDIVKQYQVGLSVGDTFAVRTAGEGIHIFFKSDIEFRQNTKEESIDLKTNKGYVIAAGSPGYRVEWEADIMHLPERLGLWLDECERLQKTNESGGIKVFTPEKVSKKLPVEKLRTILEKVDVLEFRSNDKWIEFVLSAVAACGELPEVYEILSEWSGRDEKYREERKQIERRIRSAKEKGGISAGTFIYYLRECGISEHLVNQVVRSISVFEILNFQEGREKPLPFPDPDYYELAMSKEAQEFYNSGAANTAAASLLEFAVGHLIVYVKTEKKAYFFNGNRYEVLCDQYNVIYTLLMRTLKTFYANTQHGELDDKKLIKCTNSLNDTTFKDKTWKEFIRKNGIYNEYIEWDSPEIAETMTCTDGIIDFKNYNIVRRAGLPSEFRLSYVDCKVEDVLKSSEPVKFIHFLKDIMPDKDTFETLKYCLSLSISGNASKRLFQIWHGEGRNGKSLLVDLMHSVLGNEKAYKYSVETILEQRHKQEKYDKVNFHGKYFCYTSEVSKNQRLDIEVIKSLTGNDVQNARQIFEGIRQFRPTWQLVFIANDLPDFSSDDAIQDRILVIPFTMKFCKDDNDRQKYIRSGKVKLDHIKQATEAIKLMPELEAEKSGILKALIDWYIILQTKMNGVIPVSKECERKKERYLSDNDETANFINECCFVDPDNESLFVTTDELCEAYRDFIGKAKMSDRAVLREIMNYDNRLEKTSRMVTVQEYDQGLRTTVGKIKQRRGLKRIGLLTDNAVIEIMHKNRGKKADDYTDDDLANLI
jgi:hypothetical protein